MKRFFAVTVAGLLALSLSPARAVDTYTPSCRIIQMPTGSNDSTWGTKANAAWAMLEKCIAGTTSISVTSGNVTLTTANNAADQARNAILVFTGTPGTTRTITMPDVSHLTWVINNSDSSIVFTAGAGTTATVTAGKKALIFTDGSTNAVSMTGVIDLTSNVSGSLPVANGGTGGTTSTGTGAVVLASSPTLSSPTMTTPTLGVATTTSINKLSITAPATGATLAVADGKTLTASNSLTLAGTDGTTMTFPSTSATVARTDAANTFTGHQTIEGVTSTGATGTGKFVFDTSPTLTTPTIGVAAATSVNKVTITAPASGSTLTIADGKTLTVSGSSTILGSQAAVLLASGNVTTGSSTLLTQVVSSWTSYKRIEFQFESVAGSGSGAIVLQFSTNAGSSFISTGYAYGGFAWTGGVSVNVSNASASYVLLTGSGATINLLSVSMSGLNSSSPTIVESQATRGYVDKDFESGSLAGTTNINAVKFYFTSGTVTAGTYRIIGYP